VKNSFCSYLLAHGLRAQEQTDPHGCIATFQTSRRQAGLTSQPALPGYFSAGDKENRSLKA
jgi:hypothetical protein